MNSLRSSESESGQEPWPWAGSEMRRTRSFNPPSHSLEQAPQAVQSASSQSRSHDCMLHGSVSVVSPQRAPPCSGVRITLRVRSFTPPPQSALQVLHPLQVSTSQSTGQGKSLHVRSMVSGGQAAPPYAGWILTLRLSSCMPPPHVTVHSPGTHSLTSQSATRGVRSLILKISLRIFLAPQISAWSCSMFPLHSFIVFSYSAVISTSCELLRRDCSSASFCFFVAAASLVCSSFSRVSNDSICASKFALSFSHCVSNSLSCSRSVSRLSTISVWMLRNLSSILWHCGLLATEHFLLALSVGGFADVGVAGGSNSSALRCTRAVARCAVSWKATAKWRSTPCLAMSDLRLAIALFST